MKKTELDESKNILILRSVLRFLKLILLTKGGLNLYENHNLLSKLSEYIVKNENSEYELYALKDLNMGFDKCELFAMIRENGHIDYPCLLEKFKNLDTEKDKILEYVNRYIIYKGNISEFGKIKHILIEQIYYSLYWKLYVFFHIIAKK